MYNDVRLQKQWFFHSFGQGCQDPRRLHSALISWNAQMRKRNSADTTTQVTAAKPKVGDYCSYHRAIVNALP